MTLHPTMAQDLADHRWENRVLLLLSTEISQEDLGQQISEIRSNRKEMEERKLITFLLTPDQSYMGFNFDESLSNRDIYRKYKVTEGPFEMVLIGLDGGVKKRYTGYEDLAKIFAVIDGMPMRRAELKSKKERN